MKALHEPIHRDSQSVSHKAGDATAATRHTLPTIQRQQQQQAQAQENVMEIPIGISRQLRCTEYGVVDGEREMFSSDKS